MESICFRNCLAAWLFWRCSFSSRSSKNHDRTALATLTPPAIQPAGFQKFDAQIFAAITAALEATAPTADVHRKVLLTSRGSYCAGPSMLISSRSL